MPHYFFHILDSDSASTLDDEGAEFEGYETARHEAVESVRDLAVEATKQGGNVSGTAVEITDTSGKVPETIRTRETFG